MQDGRNAGKIRSLMISRGLEVLQKLNVPVFRPLPPLLSGWAQTVSAPYLPQRPDLPPTRTHELLLSDGDRLHLVENRPTNWKSGDRMAVLVHGLTGNHQSNYMSRLARKFQSLGVLTFRVNLRGCGPGFGLARNLYHSGRSEDVRQVLEWLSEAHPDSPATLIGFSLGGNISLKMAGEDGGKPSGRLDSLIAVSPPVDLAASARRLSRPENRFFDTYFVRQVIRDIEKLHLHFPDLGSLHWPPNLNLTGFDDLYTAPRSGFADASDYYRKCSSLPLLDQIRVPTLILSSMDDPVVDSTPLLSLSGSEHLDLILPDHGGHVGFIGWQKSLTDIRWMDQLILNWMKFNLSSI